jgi:hypothetical protein
VERYIDQVVEVVRGEVKDQETVERIENRMIGVQRQALS